MNSLCLNDDRVLRLQKAMLLIESVAAEMDSSAIECESCGSRRRTNWQAHQVKIKLEGVYAKIRSLLNAEWYHRREGE